MSGFRKTPKSSTTLLISIIFMDISSAVFSCLLVKVQYYIVLNLTDTAVLFDFRLLITSFGIFKLLLNGLIKRDP